MPADHRDDFKFETRSSLTRNASSSFANSALRRTKCSRRCAITGSRGKPFIAAGSGNEEHWAMMPDFEEGRWIWVGATQICVVTEVVVEEVADGPDKDTVGKIGAWLTTEVARTLEDTGSVTMGSSIGDAVAKIPAENPSTVNDVWGAAKLATGLITERMDGIVEMIREALQISWIKEKMQQTKKHGWMVCCRRSLRRMRSSSGTCGETLIMRGKSFLTGRRPG